MYKWMENLVDHIADYIIPLDEIDWVSTDDDEMG